MAKITIPLEVEEATYQLGLGLGNFASDMVMALKDGFQVKDVGPIISAVMLDLVPVVAKFKDLPADLKEDPTDFVSAWVASGLEIWKKIK